MRNKSVSIVIERHSGLAVYIRFRRGSRTRTFTRWTQSSYKRVYRLIEPGWGYIR